MFVSRKRRTVKAEVDWLGKGAGAETVSAADYRAAMLKKQTERDVQRGVVKHFRSALVQPCKVIAIPNQRAMSLVRADPGQFAALPEAMRGAAQASATQAKQRKVLAALIADGMEPDAPDLLFLWDARFGEPGNRGVALVEMKRLKGSVTRQGQTDFISDLSAMGHAAGVANSLEQVEAILTEAGAPLRIRLLGRARPASHTPKTSEAPATGIANASKNPRKGR
jgi:hypothetical protein